MNDYRTKRRFRHRKLTKQGFYEQRRKRSRARRKEATSLAIGKMSIASIAHPENLIRVYDRLKQQAGQAPGPDGIAYTHLGRREVGAIMRDLSRELYRGSYTPSTARTVRIEKPCGGYRTLKLRSILNRVVAAAVAESLAPYFEGIFLDGSHGFRPRRGLSTMLLAMERIIVGQRRFIIAQDDIKQAFDYVPVDCTVRLYRQHIADKKLLHLIEQILRGNPAEPGAEGIDQGSGLSPLTLNVVLHHTLDIPSSRNAAHPPWLRYADNIVYLARSVHEGKAAIQAAGNLLTPIGMSLKGIEGPPVDLLTGQAVTILGLSLRWENGQIRYDLTEQSWNSLESLLATTHTAANPPMAAQQATKGWIEASGPAFAFEGKRGYPVLDWVLDRIQEIAATAGYRELSRSLLRQYLQSSRDRWALQRNRNAQSIRKGNRAHKAPVAPRNSQRNRAQEEKGVVAPLTTDRPGIAMPEAGTAAGMSRDDFGSVEDGNAVVSAARRRSCPHNRASGLLPDTGSTWSQGSGGAPS